MLTRALASKIKKAGVYMYGGAQISCYSYGLEEKAVTFPWLVEFLWLL